MLPCAVLGGVLMAACQVLIYRYAPVEQTMGLVQKIFYTHLPLAWWSFVSFFLVCVSGVAYLKTRNRHWDAVAGAAAEVGVVLSGLALVSGSIWARHSWGVWWTWDPRLTTTMILWFLYAGYLVLRKMDMPRERQANLCAVVGIVAFVDVPLVFLSARLWRSIHPAVFANKSGGLEPEMKIAAIAAVACFGLVWAGLVGLGTAVKSPTAAPWMPCPAPPIPATQCSTPSTRQSTATTMRSRGCCKDERETEQMESLYGGHHS